MHSAANWREERYLRHGEQFAGSAMPPVHIRLTRKFAGLLNGCDLRPFEVGQILSLCDRSALMLIAEGWAEPVSGAPATADDRPRKRREPEPT
jgi:hypothetical protein